MPWVLSVCWESSNLTNDRISISTHNGNSRTGKRSKRPKGKNCKADSAWNRRAPEELRGVPQDLCWGLATGAELQSVEAYALWLQAAGVGRKGLRGLRSRAFGLCALPQAQGAGNRGVGLRAGVSGSRQQAQI